MMLIDSHCHLNFPEFKDDLDQVIAHARENGVGLMQTICTEMAEFEEVRGIAERYEHIYCSVGVHPHESGKTELVPVDEIVARTRHEKVIGIGETGLDYYYEHSDRASQQQSFRHHIAAARQTGLPLIVHTRDAEEDTIRILTEEYRQGAFTGVIHCFTSSQQLAEKMLEIGFYISFSGIISFKNAQNLRETAKIIPLERMLIETDAPFLAPVPHRGKRNEPAFVSQVNKVLAELRQLPETDIGAVTTNNFFRLFTKATRPEGM